MQLLLLFLIFYFTLVKTSPLSYDPVDKPTTVCEGAIGKQPGKTDILAPVHSTRSPNSSELVETSDDCGRLCKTTPWCKMSEYVGTKSTLNTTCRLFDSISYTYERALSDPGNTIYIWEPCTQKDCRHSAPLDRCTGMWVRYDDMILKTGRAPLNTLLDVTQEDCLKRCYKINVCAFVNFKSIKSSKKGTCYMYIKWPYIFAPTKPRNGWFYVAWQCCNIDVDKRCRYIVSEGCMGKWIISEKQMKPNPKKKYIDWTFTLSPQACVDECALHDNCGTPWYNDKICLCLLQAKYSINGSCASSKVFPTQFLTNISMPMWYWNWTCCSSTANKTVSTSVLRGGPNPNCICVTNKVNISVLYDNCTGPDFSATRRTLPPGKSAFYKYQEIVQISNETFSQISTGYDILWLSSVYNKFVKVCKDVKMCDIFSGATQPGECPKIITRRKWYADKEPMQKFAQKPDFIAISYAPYFRCPCRTLGSCIDRLQYLQYFYRKEKSNILGNNFLIGDDGRVYESFGWDNEGPYTKEIQPSMFGINFLSSYKAEYPSLEALRAAKQLIACGVSKRKLSTAYKVVGVNYFNRKTYQLGERINSIIYHWPLFEGFESKKDCHQHFDLWIVWTLLSVLFTSVCISFTVHKLHRNDYFHSKDCRLLRHIYRDHIMSDNAAVLNLVPMFPAAGSQIWSNLDVRVREEDPYQMGFSTKLADVYLCRGNFKSPNRLPPCNCFKQIQNLYRHACDTDNSFFIPMLNNLFCLKFCLRKTFVLYIAKPGDRLERSHVIVCHLDSIDISFQRAMALRFNECLCGKILLERCIERPFTFLGVIVGTTRRDEAVWNHVTERRRRFNKTLKKGAKMVSFETYRKNSLPQYILGDVEA